MTYNTCQIVGSAEILGTCLEFGLGHEHEPETEHVLAHEHEFGDASGREREADFVHAHGFATAYAPDYVRIDPEPGGTAAAAEIGSAEPGTASESEGANFD